MTILDNSPIETTEKRVAELRHAVADAWEQWQLAIASYAAGVDVLETLMQEYRDRCRQLGQALREAQS